jgi:hypothetical protein
MKFWFDILTPKQVNFFKPVVDELRKRGHEVLCTSRKYREVEELALLKGLDLVKVGEHGGGSLYGKVKASAERTEKLISIIQGFSPDCLASFSSPEAVRVAFGLGMRNIGFNDSPHAEAVCKLTVPLMSRLLCPWVIPLNAFTKYGIARNQIIHYKALDPAMWIRSEDKQMYRHEDLKLDAKKRTIVFRLEESKAAYLSNARSVSEGMLRSLIANFPDANIVVLCRYLDQVDAAKAEFGSSVMVIDKVIDGRSLLLLSDLFIGSGGTMNCEAALLGIPNISYTMHEILVNKFLFSKNVSYRCRNAAEMVKLARKMLTDERFRKSARSRSLRLLSSMEDPKGKIVKTLEKQVN